MKKRSLVRRAARRNPAKGYGVIGMGGFKNAADAATKLLAKYGKGALGYARDYYTVATRDADKKFWTVVYGFIYDEVADVQTNPVTKAPPAVWAKNQLANAKSALSSRDNAVIYDKHIWPDGYLHLVILRGLSQGFYRWILIERRPGKRSLAEKIVGAGTAFDHNDRLVIENSIITRPYRGQGLYLLALKAMKSSSGLPLVSATSRSKAAESSWKRMGGVKLEGEDRWALTNPRRPGRVRNPSLITPLDAFKTAVSRRDAPSALSWYNVILSDEYRIDMSVSFDEVRAAKQRGECSPNDVCNYSIRSAARTQQLESLGMQYELFSRSAHADKAMRDLNSARSIISNGRGKFFSGLRRATDISSVRRFQDKFNKKPSNKPPKESSYIVSRRAKVQAKVQADVRRRADRIRYASVRAAGRSHQRLDVEGIAKLERASKIKAILEWRDIYHGIELRRLLRVLRHPQLLPGTPQANDALRDAGVPARVIAGNYWKATSTAKSPADFLRGGANTPTLRDALLSAGVDPLDPDMCDTVRRLSVPSVNEIVRACNLITRTRESQSRSETESKASLVDDWLRDHSGVASYKYPAGWRWLVSGDGVLLARWAARNGACIIGRIEHSSMNNIKGLLFGPKKEVVGISVFGSNASVEGEHSCCDVNNRLDVRAFNWASKPQRLRVSDVDRAARRAHLASRAADRRQRAHARLARGVGSSRDYIRAESRGDWAALANNPQFGGRPRKNLPRGIKARR